ncbi:hypothetical protein ACFFK0_07690 [Paenibacillus chartarius]|uniref:Uncharacterized protein n=1 Tax=Paenibacillus chartarius TaxID=747481 RepID=A0ABV6DI65_9BACL
MMSLINFIIGVLAFWLILRIPLLYSIIMMMITFSVFSLIEYISTQLFPKSLITFVTEHNQYLFFWSGLLICVAQLILTCILHLTRFGFSFIPQSKIPVRSTFIGGPLVKRLVIFSFPIVLAGSILVFLYPEGYILHSIGLLIILGVILRKSFRWEMMD